MLSRVAESIYWMNRYVERAENVARFVHVNLYLELDVPQIDDADPRATGSGGGGGGQWRPLIWTTGDERVFQEHYKEYTRDNVIKFLTFDLENPNSIVSCVKWARENARSI